MSERYFCPTAISGKSVTLAGTEAHHLSQVMRAEEGDKVVLFDGTGNECEASVIAVGKREVKLHVERREEVDREASCQLTLAVAMPKGDRQKWLVEKATELGVAQVIPLVTERSVVKLKESGLDRLRRVIIEASKQCGRNRLMELQSPLGFDELICDARSNVVRVIAHPPTTCVADHQDLARDDAESRTDAIALIGPEGGFTDDEVQHALNAGWQCISLGKRILRIETAALKLAALLLGD